MCPNTMAPTNTTASSEENKKKRSPSASSGEAQEVEGDAKRSCHGSSSAFPIGSGFGSSIDNPIVEGVNDLAEKWKELEPVYRQQVSKDINIMAQSLLSPITMKDGAIHKNLSFFQGISQNAMEIVGDFFEDYYRQMGHTSLKKEASKEHKSITPRKIGEDENYDTGGDEEET